MIAKLCIDHETATADWILVMFFETFAGWDWFDPKSPISLTPVDTWQTLVEVSESQFYNIANRFKEPPRCPRTHPSKSPHELDTKRFHKCDETNRR